MQRDFDRQIKGPKPVTSIDDEEPGAGFCRGAMARFPVSGLVALAGCQGEAFSVGKLGFEFAIKAENYVPFRTPVISQIARGVFDDPHSYVAEILGLPESPPGLPRMFRYRDICPISR